MKANLQYEAIGNLRLYADDRVLSVSGMSAKLVHELPEGGLKPTLLSCDLVSPVEAGFAKAGNSL